MDPQGRKADVFHPSGTSRSNHSNSNNHQSQQPFHRVTRSAPDASSSPPSRSHSSLSISSYQTTSISKLYALNHQILTAFLESYQQSPHHPWTYKIGLQFLETAVEEIPQHGYYFASRHDQERVQSLRNALHVATVLLGMLPLQNLEPEAPRQKERLKHLVEQAQAQIEYKRKTTYNQRATASSSSSDRLCAPLLAFHDNWTSRICPTDTKSPPSHTHRTYNNAASTFDPYYHQTSWDRTHNHAHQQHSTQAATPPRHPRKDKTPRAKTPPKHMAFDPYLGPPPLQRSDCDDDDDDRPYHSVRHLETPKPQPLRRVQTDPQPQQDDDDIVWTLPPPTATTSSSSSALERALFVSGMEEVATRDRDDLVATGILLQEQEPLPRDKRRPNDGLDIATLSMLYQEDYDSVQTQARIRISTIPTWQGRLEGSINGCTVIAPLLCIHHFHNDAQIPDPGLPDVLIQQVIDDETPHILPQVRDELGLTPQAFLIPSDAHDYLLDHHLLSSDQFVNVIGGNILQDEHLEALLKEFAKLAQSQTKCAATFFFHQHVICILQLQRHDSKLWYDVLDSLALANGDTNNKNGVRYRCLDPEALKAFLRWYACQKFTQENRTYMDMYAWDDTNTDFDPRVFQAFLWKAS